MTNKENIYLNQVQNKLFYKDVSNRYNQIFRFEMFQCIIAFIRNQHDITKVCSKTTQKLVDRRLLLFLIVFLTDAPLDIILKMRQFNLNKLLNLMSKKLKEENKDLKFNNNDWETFIILGVNEYIENANKDIKYISNQRTHTKYYKINFRLFIIEYIITFDSNYNMSNSRNEIIERNETNQRFKKFYTLLYELPIFQGEYLKNREIINYTFSILTDETVNLRKTNAVKELQDIIEDFNDFKTNIYSNNDKEKNKEKNSIFRTQLTINDLDL